MLAIPIDRNLGLADKHVRRGQQFIDAFLSRVDDFIVRRGGLNPRDVFFINWETEYDSHSDVCRQRSKLVELFTLR